MVNATIDEGVTTASQKVDFAGDPHAVPRFYANHALVQTSLFDVRIQSNQIVEQTPERAEVVPQLILHMSHIHARMVANIILEHLKILEEKIGNIPDPSQLAKQRKSA